jgi:hypothetical protein
MRFKICHFLVLSRRAARHAEHLDLPSLSFGFPQSMHSPAAILASRRAFALAPFWLDLRLSSLCASKHFSHIT